MIIKKITNWHRFSFDMQLEDFYNYIDTMEGSIESHKSSLEERFENESKHLTEPEKQEFYEFAFFDEYYNLDKTYSLILRKSLFISLYSFMESELQNIARKIEKQNLTDIKISDISHRGLHQYLFYIETVNKININISINVRNRFLQYNHLRNHFVHNGDDLINQKKYNSLKSLSYINFEEIPRKDYSKYQIGALEKDFNPNYLSLVSKFFDELYKGIDESNITL